MNRIQSLNLLVIYCEARGGVGGELVKLPVLCSERVQILYRFFLGLEKQEVLENLKYDLPLPSF
jgi:hypothetical protein